MDGKQFSKSKFLAALLAAGGLSFGPTINAALPNQPAIDQQLTEDKADAVLRGLIQDKKLIDLLDKANKQGLTEDEYLYLRENVIQFAGKDIPFV